MDSPGNRTAGPIRFPGGFIEPVQPSRLSLFALLTSTYSGSPDHGSFILDRAVAATVETLAPLPS